MKTKLSLFLITLFFSVNSFGQAFTYNGINYDVLTPTTVRVGLNPGFVGAANIPSVVTYLTNNYTVTEIINNSFYNCSGLTSVTIPNTITSIGHDAFSGCSGLTSVTIPNSVNSIEANTFANCSGLTSITIPNFVTNIGDSAFSSCTGLTSVIIPNSVTSIGISAFYLCTGLTSVTIPNLVTSIKANTFGYCSGLTSITIPNSVMSIGQGAFYHCTGLTTINIPNSVTYLGNQILEGCTNLNSITVNWTTPLPVDYWVFYNLNYPSITLNVPSGTESLYDASQYWTDFNISTLGTSDFSSIKLKYSPNPTNSNIIFSQVIEVLEIYDITGKKVKSFENATTTFDVSGLEKGIYLLKGKTIEGSEFNEKLIKE